MHTYLVMFYGGITALKYQNLGKASEMAQKAHANAWAAWMAGLTGRGALVTGFPLDTAGRRISNSAAEEYTFPEDSAGGFIVIKAGSMEDTTEMLKDCPIIANGGFIMVRLCGTMK